MAGHERNIDKGYAWVVLMAAFCVQMIAAMLTYSPGVVNIVILEQVENDLGKTSWIGATLYGTFTLMGPVAGLVYKRLGPRVTTVVGGVIVLIGMTSASFCQTVVGLILTYGLTTGLGMCLGGNVVGVVPGEYFIKRRSIAYGITMSGGAMGLFVTGPLLRYLLVNYGLRGSLLLFGAVAFHVCVAGMLFWDKGPVVLQHLHMTREYSSYKSQNKTTDSPIVKDVTDSHSSEDEDEDIFIPLKNVQSPHLSKNSELIEKTQTPSKRKSSLEVQNEITDAVIVKDVSYRESTEDAEEDVWIPLEHLTTQNPNNHSEIESENKRKRSWLTGPLKVPNLAAFVMYNTSIIFWSLGESSCMFHLPNYVQSRGSTLSQASSLFTAVGTGGLFARIVTGMIASDSSIGFTTLHVGLAGIAGVLTLLFPFYSHTFALQVTFSVLYGIYNQGINALMSPITISLIGLSNVAMGFGTVYFSCGIGFFTGPPLASAMYEVSGSYDYTFVFSGSCLVLSSITTCVAQALNKDRLHDAS